ncbi:hypothetical protein B0H11DRAFT_1913075 [Mycena galericulata]|nr:hypothetical protein B0H11DRAFT_1913075 [Mycena galericulata]
MYILFPLRIVTFSILARRAPAGNFGPSPPAMKTRHQQTPGFAIARIYVEGTLAMAKPGLRSTQPSRCQTTTHACPTDESNAMLLWLPVAAMYIHNDDAHTRHDPSRNFMGVALPLKRKLRLFISHSANKDVYYIFIALEIRVLMPFTPNSGSSDSPAAADSLCSTGV